MRKRFVLYGLVGWCMEVFWTGLHSLLRKDKKLVGQTSLWMFPIYGLVVCMEPICDRLKRRSVVVRGGVYTILSFVVEYTTGWLLRKVLGECPWDYSKSRFSIRGLIRLDYAPAWFTAGLIFEKLHHVLKDTRFQKKSLI